MKAQLAQLLDVLNATDIEETEDRLYFKIGNRQQELCPDYPLIVIIESSSYCNLKCLGCPQKDMTRPKTFIKPELFRKIIDEIVQHKIRSWFHFMGEPLLNPDIFELVDYATKKGLDYFGISSNGLLLNEKNIVQILDSGMKRFEISIDSLDTQVFSRMRPGGKLQKIIDNTREYFRVKYQRGQKYPITSISVREMAENADEIAKFAQYWNKIIRPPDFVLSIRFDSWGGHESLKHATYQIPTNRMPCLKLWNTAIILADGRVVTCNAMFDGQQVMGDVNSETLAEIWNSQAYFELRQKHIDGLTDTLAICSKCDDWYRETGPKQFKNWTYE